MTEMINVKIVEEGKQSWKLRDLKNELGSTDFAVTVTLPLMAYAGLCNRFAQHGIDVDYNQIQYETFYTRLHETLDAYNDYEQYELLASYDEDVNDKPDFDENDPISSAIDTLDYENNKEYIEYAGTLLEIVQPPQQQRIFTGEFLQVKEHVDYMKREFYRGKYTPQILTIAEHDELKSWMDDVSHDIDAMIKVINDSASTCSLQ